MSQFDDVIPVVQSWSGSMLTPLGSIPFIEDKQKEFYNGNYSGSNLTVTEQSLFFNPFLKNLNPTTLDIPEEPWDNTLSSKFSGSDFDSLVNNVTLNRTSTFNQDADYYKNVYLPDNLKDILNNIAPKTQTPDSNYTSHKVILSRYLGSRLHSADYNFYTPSGFIRPASGNIPEGVLPYFLDGSTGSWGGDTSYGKTSAIDSYPRYFAHFKYAKENKEFWDTATYKIDALIECPQEDLKGTVAEPKVLKIEDDNQRLYEVANNFVKNRKTKIDFRIENYKGIDYQTLETAPQKIMQGGSKFILLAGNELSKTSYIESCSFANPTWAVMHTSSQSDLEAQINNLGPAVTIQNFNLAERENIDLIAGNLGRDYYLEASSSVFILKGGEIGVGSATEFNTIGQIMTYGPGLGLIHTYNVALKKHIAVNPTFASSTFNIGIPKSLPTYSNLNNKKDPDNYFTFKVTSSVTDLSSYEYYKIPFLIERGDQIRVTWKDIQFPVPVYTSTDFVVTEVTTGSSSDYKRIQFYADYKKWTFTDDEFPWVVRKSNAEAQAFYNMVRNMTTPYNNAQPPTIEPGWEFNGNHIAFVCAETTDPFKCKLPYLTFGYNDIETGIGNPYPLFAPGPGHVIYQIKAEWRKLSLTKQDTDMVVPGDSIYDTIKVYPNPLDFNIPNNEIKAFTIRRRVDADNSVVVFQIPPKNSDGFNTLSSQGFIIPNDFSQAQKDNVLTLVNALEAKNVFKPDD